MHKIPAFFHEIYNDNKNIIDIIYFIDIFPRHLCLKIQEHFGSLMKAGIIWAVSWENQQFGFWTGPTQIRLYCHRNRLEAWKFRI